MLITRGPDRARVIRLALQDIERKSEKYDDVRTQRCALRELALKYNIQEQNRSQQGAAIISGDRYREIVCECLRDKTKIRGPKHASRGDLFQKGSKLFTAEYLREIGYEKRTREPVSENDSDYASDRSVQDEEETPVRKLGVSRSKTIENSMTDAESEQGDSIQVQATTSAQTSRESIAPSQPGREGIEVDGPAMLAFSKAKEPPTEFAVRTQPEAHGETQAARRDPLDEVLPAPTPSPLSHRHLFEEPTSKKRKVSDLSLPAMLESNPSTHQRKIQETLIADEGDQANSPTGPSTLSNAKVAKKLQSIWMKVEDAASTIFDVAFQHNPGALWRISTQTPPRRQRNCIAFCLAPARSATGRKGHIHLGGRVRLTAGTSFPPALQARLMS